MKTLTLAIVAAGLLGMPVFFPALEVGAAAPTCTLREFQDGGPIDLSRFRGQVVYLDFWASWCGPCAQSMPFLNELQQALGPKGFKVLAVNLDDNPDDARAFLVPDRSGGEHPPRPVGISS